MLKVAIFNLYNIFRHIQHSQTKFNNYNYFSMSLNIFLTIFNIQK